MRLTMPAMHYPRKMGVRGQLRSKDKTKVCEAATERAK